MKTIKTHKKQIFSYVSTTFWVLMFFWTLSFFEVQTQGHFLRAESQLDTFSSDDVASGSTVTLLPFQCFATVSKVCGRQHYLTRLAVREVGFSLD